jgi:hypothetical protein
MTRILALALALTLSGATMAVEQNPKPRTAPRVTGEQATDEHWRNFGNLLEEQYRDQKAGKPWSPEERQRRLREIGGIPAAPRPAPELR